jgi:hypothetical protein
MKDMGYEWLQALLFGIILLIGLFAAGSILGFDLNNLNSPTWVFASIFIIGVVSAWWALFKLKGDNPLGL